MMHYIIPTMSLAFKFEFTVKIIHEKICQNDVLHNSKLCCENLRINVKKYNNLKVGTYRMRIG